MKKQLVLAASGAALACSLSAQPARTPAQAAEAAAPRVLLQVCLPQRKAVSEEVIVDITDMPANLHHIMWGDALAQARVTGQYARSEGGSREHVAVRSARPAEGAGAAAPVLFIAKVQGGVVASESGGGEPLADTTELGQPIYTRFTYNRPGEILAVYVALFGKDAGERTNFWFKPPQAIPAEGFTPWMPPDAQESPRPGHHGVRSRLFAGKGLAAGTVAPDAPRMRFMLRSMDEHRRDTEPTMRAARIRRVGEVAGFDPVVQGPRVVQGASPGC